MSWTTFDSAGAALSRSFSDTPVGTVTGYAGASAPTGWLACDGSAVNRTTYAELYSVIGTTYGTGNGSTTFNLPTGDGDIIYAQSISSRVATASPPQYVTSLPSSPVDGQTVVYAADASNGVMWTLRYRAASSSSYKWEFVGGADLLTVSNSGTQSFTNSWTALAGSVTAPLAGDYSVEFGCMVYGDSSTGRDANIQAATNTPSGASDSLRLYVTNTVHDISSRQSKLSAISASATIQLWGKNDSSSATTTTEYRWLAVTPVRVG